MVQREKGFVPKHFRGNINFTVGRVIWEAFDLDYIGGDTTVKVDVKDTRTVQVD